MNTALVLGGGGVTGIAWMTGLLHAFERRGLDLTTAEKMIGTSAGSVVAAQLACGRDLARLYEQQTTPAHAELGAGFSTRQLLDFAVKTAKVRRAPNRLARIGRVAATLHADKRAARLAVIKTRLGPLQWPTHPALMITAVDTETGELTVWDKDSGCDLIDAVASSCAVPMVWPAVEIGGRLYMDGGVRSTTNADLATGVDRIVVIAPLPAATKWGTSKIPAEVATTGARRWAMVSPDEASLRAIGRNVLDPSKRVAAALAGYAQGLRQAAEMAEGWSLTDS